MMDRIVLGRVQVKCSKCRKNKAEVGSNGPARFYICRFPAADPGLSISGVSGEGGVAVVEWSSTGPLMLGNGLGVTIPVAARWGSLTCSS